jgi:hypothetical protein
MNLKQLEQLVRRQPGSHSGAAVEPLRREPGHWSRITLGARQKGGCYSVYYGGNRGKSKLRVHRVKRQTADQEQMIEGGQMRKMQLSLNGGELK